MMNLAQNKLVIRHAKSLGAADKMRLGQKGGGFPLLMPFFVNSVIF